MQQRIYTLLWFVGVGDLDDLKAILRTWQQHVKLLVGVWAISFGKLLLCTELC